MGQCVADACIFSNVSPQSLELLIVLKQNGEMQQLCCARYQHLLLNIPSGGVLEAQMAGWLGLCGAEVGWTEKKR